MKVYRGRELVVLLNQEGSGEGACEMACGGGPFILRDLKRKGKVTVAGSICFRSPCHCICLSDI